MPKDRRLERHWDPQFEEGLPDCRRNNRENDRVYRAGMWWDRVYCANCGKLHALVTSDWSPHVFAICDDCAVTLGPPPGSMQLTPQDERAATGTAT